jgi:hypothetical protein
MMAPNIMWLNPDENPVGRIDVLSRKGTATLGKNQ